MNLIIELVIVLLIEFWGGKQNALQFLFTWRDKLDFAKIIEPITKYTNKLNTKKLGALSTYSAIIGVVLFLVLSVSLVLLLLPNVIASMFKIVILFYCFSPTAKQDQNVHVEYFERYYASLFYYVCFGPVGGLLYKYFSVARVNDTTCGKLHAIASWLPARMVTIVYAITGKFHATLLTWWNMVKEPRMPSSELLITCSEAALEQEVSTEMLARSTVIAWSVVLVVLRLLIS